MRITLYQNRSESNVVDKVLTKIADVDGTLREETSILNPEFNIDVDSAGIILCNYIYIEEFNRYYFVNDIESVRNGLWRISCHVDVLSTYKNEIRMLSGIIARQEFEYNLLLDDDKFLVDSPRQFVYKAFPNRAPAASNGASFVVSIAGGPDEAQ